MMIRTVKPILASVLLMLFAMGGVSASPRDFTMPATVDAPLPYVVQVVSPQRACAAISDSLGLIAIGNRAVAPNAGVVSIFGLDAGKIVGTPVPPAPPPPKPAAGAPAALPAPPLPPKPLFTITLPRPGSLAAFGNGAISLVFHPKLPLLYIWQDTWAPRSPAANTNVVMKEFDHLLIYSVSATAPPKLVQAVGRGQEYFYGQLSGSIVIDAAASRIYLPNLRMPDSPDNASTNAVGCIKLDAKGLPVRLGDKPDLTLDSMAPYGSYPEGLGFVPVSDDVIIVAGCLGPATLDHANRRAHWSHFQLTPLAYSTYRLAGHPTLPVVYLSMMGYGYLFRMEHADGYLTLLPQTVIINVPIYTMPVVMAKRKKIAFGGANRVHAVSIDDEGWYTNTMEQMVVANPVLEALVYSEKFDKLYAAVEQAPTMRRARDMFSLRRSVAMAAVVLSLGIAPAFARTITLTEADADKMAAIAAEAPRMSWAGCDQGGGCYSNPPIHLALQHSFLIHFPLDKIPKGYRITKAEWSIPVENFSGYGVRFFVWRLLADWSAGVCYQYRTTKPKPVEWTVAGARGSSSDRAAEPTLIVNPKNIGELLILNVTRDVEFWYTGAAANDGWLFTVEDDNMWLRPATPLSNQSMWKLQITYEPQ